MSSIILKVIRGTSTGNIEPVPYNEYIRKILQY